MSADEEDADQGPALDEESTSGMEQGAHARHGEHEEAVGEDNGDEDREASSRILGPHVGSKFHATATRQLLTSAIPAL